VPGPVARRASGCASSAFSSFSTTMAASIHTAAQNRLLYFATTCALLSHARRADQLSLVRALVEEDPKCVSAEDAVSVSPRVHRRPLSARRTRVRLCTGPHLSARSMSRVTYSTMLRRSTRPTARVGHHSTSPVRTRPCVQVMHGQLSGVVSAGQEDVVRELVGAGADVKRTNDKGLTPLCVSRRLGVEHR
jgi:hypothetical protein